ncbi:MAG: hypothetical protein HQL17_02925 [Candidatus Omnitrophica bacterium]|nr:hypothetical protein [Candidatus Omnitrophota bacterium]
MKSFFIKVFMLFAAALCMLEGLVLVAVGLGQLSSERLMAVYSNLMAAPKAMTTVFSIGAFFIALGFILLVLSSRTKPAPHEIKVEKDGKVLNIPERAVKEFILQIIQQNPCAADVTVEFVHTGEAIDIEISASLDGVSSIYKELNEIEEVLKAEIDRVFEWKGFKITFHLRGIGIDRKKKYFASSVAPVVEAVAEAEEKPAAEEKSGDTQEATMAEVGEAVTDEEASDDEEKAPEVKHSKDQPKDKTKGSSFLSKMLLGR